MKKQAEHQLFTYAATSLAQTQLCRASHHCRTVRCSDMLADPKTLAVATENGSKHMNSDTLLDDCASKRDMSSESKWLTREMVRLR